MYKRIGDISDKGINHLRSEIYNARWKEVKGSGADFKTLFYNGKIEGFSEYKQAFFLLIPPRGKVHRHIDTPRTEETYHIPIYTNDGCVNNMYPGGSFHLEVGGIYWVDRQIEHDSVNNGETDRVHLLVEI